MLERYPGPHRCASVCRRFASAVTWAVTVTSAADLAPPSSSLPQKAYVRRKVLPAEEAWVDWASFGKLCLVVAPPCPHLSWCSHSRMLFVLLSGTTQSRFLPRPRACFAFGGVPKASGDNLSRFLERGRAILFIPPFGTSLHTMGSSLVPSGSPKEMKGESRANHSLSSHLFLSGADVHRPCGSQFPGAHLLPNHCGSASAHRGPFALGGRSLGARASTSVVSSQLSFPTDEAHRRCVRGDSPFLRIKMITRFLTPLSVAH